MSIKNKKVCMGSLYRSPSQTQDQFDILLINFEQLIGDAIAKNPLFLLITGDFNVRSANWWKNDLCTSEGTQVDSFTTSHGLTQIIFDSTHILSNWYSAWIWYFQISLTWQLKVDFIHPYTLSVTIKLHSQSKYPPLYKCLFWGYKNADIPSINHAFDIFN